MIFTDIPERPVASLLDLPRERYVRVGEERWHLVMLEDLDIMARLVDERGFPIRAAFLSPDLVAGRAETLGDVVKLAQVETGLREPIVAELAAWLLRRAIVLGPALSVGPIDGALDAGNPRARFGCYQDPGGVLVLGFERGNDDGPEPCTTDDTSPFGAAYQFVNTLGITRAREALDKAKARA